MDARAFYLKVAERTMLSKEEAADLTRAVLEIVARRVSAGEVRDLARQLPEPLAEAIRWNGKGPERFNLVELIRRVSKPHVGLRTGAHHADLLGSDGERVGRTPERHRQRTNRCRAQREDHQRHRPVERADT